MNNSFRDGVIARSRSTLNAWSLKFLTNWSGYQAEIRSGNLLSAFDESWLLSVHSSSAHNRFNPATKCSQKPLTQQSIFHQVRLSSFPAETAALLH